LFKKIGIWKMTDERRKRTERTTSERESKEGAVAIPFPVEERMVYAYLLLSGLLLNVLPNTPYFA
jgi:hypothetical protein